MWAIKIHGQGRLHNRLCLNADHDVSGVTSKDEKLVNRLPVTFKEGRVAFIVRRHGYSCTSDNIPEDGNPRPHSRDELSRF